MSLFFNILIVILAISFVIFIHELGHFVLAKLFGVNVEKFSIGFGREIFGFTKNKTRYCLAIFPFGGFVKMQGENFFERVSNTAKPGDFRNLHYFKRICIVSAGAIMNAFFAVFVVFLLVFSFGVYSVDKTDISIGSVLKDRPAFEAGIQEGDVLKVIGTREIKTWDDVIDFSLTHDGSFVDVVVEREGEQISFNIKPYKEGNRYVLGISNKVSYKELSFLGTCDFTYKYFKGLSIGFFNVIFVRDEIKGELIGPVGVIKELTTAIDHGFLNFLFLLAMISFNLGLINLLPLPILDGGHILIYLIEWIIGRQINQRLLEILFFIMFILLLGLMIFVTNKDLVRLFSK